MRVSMKCPTPRVGICQISYVKSPSSCDMKPPVTHMTFITSIIVALNRGFIRDSLVALLNYVISRSIKYLTTTSYHLITTRIADYYEL